MIKRSEDFYSFDDVVAFMNKLADPLSCTVVPYVKRLEGGVVRTALVVIYAEGCCDEK